MSTFLRSSFLLRIRDLEPVSGGGWSGLGWGGEGGRSLVVPPYPRPRVLHFMVQVEPLLARQAPPPVLILHLPLGSDVTRSDAAR